MSVTRLNLMRKDYFDSSSYYSRLNVLFNQLHELALDPNAVLSNSIKSDVLR